METTFDFIKKYMPVSLAYELVKNSDYQKIVDGDITGDAKELFDDEFNEQKIFYGGSLDNDQLIEETTKIFYNRLQESNSLIYEKAIEGYLKTLNK